jgi:transcriptional regulator of met regulon
MKPKYIKQDFNKREIAPSHDSWERLSARLENVDKKKKRPLMYWISAVAAILIVALSASQLLFPVMDGGTVEKVTLVNENNTTDTESKKDPVFKETKEMDLNTPVTQQESFDHQNDAKSFINPGQKTANKTSFTSRVALKGTKQQQVAAVSIDLKKIAIKTVEMPHDAMAHNGINNLTVVQEVELLLEEAFAKAETKNRVSQSINPEQLLRETEWDIEADRHNRINDGLKSGLGKLKNEAFALIRVRQ